MPARRIAGRIYEEVAVRAVEALPIISGLSIPKHDHVQLGYTGSDLTSVIYKIGGTWDTGADTYTGGTVVGQLELVYSGGNLTQIVEVP